MLEVVELTGVSPNIIRMHFDDLGPDFVSSLSRRVDLDEYAMKLATNAKIIAHIEEAKVVSMCAFYFSNQECVAFVSHLGVATTHQGRGLSRQLLEGLHETQFNSGACEASTVSLEVEEENTLAISVYSRLGFLKDTSAVASRNGVLRMTRKGT